MQEPEMPTAPQIEIEPEAAENEAAAAAAPPPTDAPRLTEETKLMPSKVAAQLKLQAKAKAVAAEAEAETARLVAEAAVETARLATEAAALAKAQAGGAPVAATGAAESNLASITAASMLAQICERAFMEHQLAACHFKFYSFCEHAPVPWTCVCTPPGTAPTTLTAPHTKSDRATAQGCSSSR